MSNPNTGVWKPLAENIELNALQSNSSAVKAVADTVRTTLGPKGLDKLLIDQAMNRHVTNDGVTILLSLRAIHPVARMIVEIAERQEEMVGDGTTTAVVMAAEMIKEGKRMIDELAIHPTKIIEGIDTGIKQSIELLEKQAERISPNDIGLEQVIKTSMNSKLDGSSLAKLVLSTIRSLGENAKYNGRYDFDKNIKVIRKTKIEDKVVKGVILERKRMDPDLPLEMKNPKIMIAKLDLKPVKESWITENSKYEEILQMEKDKFEKAKELVNKIIATGANTILIASPEVDEIVENLLVSNKIFAVRISREEIEYLSRYTGAKPVRMIEDLKNSDILGSADRIYEDEDTSLIYIEKDSNFNMVSILVTGTTKETSLERWRAVTDGINSAEAALNQGVVAGGGAVELHLAEKIRNLKLRGLEQVGINVVTVALESIMRQILTNAGFNGLEKVMAASASPENYGIDIDTGNTADMRKLGVVDPVLVKIMALQAAGEIAKSVLRIDRNLAAEDLSTQALSESKR